jgi:predicted sugar kinase
MSEQRRNKRKEQIEMKKSNSQKIMIGNVSVVIDDAKVVISTPYRKVTYFAKGFNQAYVNYATLFNGVEGAEGEREEYGKILVGLEMIPNFAHTDADLAGKIMSLFIENVGNMINQYNGISPEETEKTMEQLSNEQALEAINEELESLLPQE